MKRKLKVHFLIIAISLTSLLGGYIQSLSVPIYAADDWETLTSNEQLVDAFKVYCKSRNTVIDGSVLDAVTSFTTTTFNNICNTLGIDMTLLQAEVQRMYSGTGYKYAFTASGLSGFNRIFAEFLQNNDLAVGESVDNKELKSGRWISDDNGNGCWVYTTNLNNRSDVLYSNVVTHGSVYVYTAEQIYNLVPNVNNSTTLNFYFNQNLSSITAVHQQYNYLRVSGNLSGIRIYSPDYYRGNLCIIYFSKLSKLYLGGLHHSKSGYSSDFQITPLTEISSDSQETVIYVNTINNTTINNETVINEGDTIIYNNDGTPDNGGGGGDDPDQGDDWDPSVPTIPPAGGGTGNNNTINWPDIDIPDFNLPDFSLGDITDKFPFSIPFDLVALLTVLDGDPIAPHIEGSIPLGEFYTWDLDFDFSQFDNYARIFRAFEFIGFCIGLIYFTVRIVKG